MIDPRSQAKTILIASCAIDTANCTPVATNLRKRGYQAIVYEADKVASGSIQLDIDIQPQHGLVVQYQGKKLMLETIAAAWMRRPAIFSAPQKDRTRQEYLDTERKMAQYTLWDTVPDKAWLNHPQRNEHAEHKLTQLAIAQAVGFTIPHTIVSNSWETIRKGLPDKIVVKPSRPALTTLQTTKSVCTTPFDNSQKSLPTASMPFPGFWQPNIPKKREWRITVVGNTFFDAAIYTDDSAKDDWRIRQFTDSVQFKAETFPDKQKKMCLRYLKKFGLRFGAFDFIESDDGTITFLECNPNGQFMWLERDLGLPISNAIADELALIADRSI